MSETSQTPKAVHRLVTGTASYHPAQPDSHDPPGSPPLQKTIATETKIGDYQILAQVGQGGMGTVYRAYDPRLDRVVALKTVRRGAIAECSDLERFRLEAKAVAQLQHPGIVAIYEVGEHEGRPFFSMEYVPGKSLAEMVAQNPLPEGQAARYVQAIADAMEYAHRKGVVHRDLKPSNVLIDAADEPRVTDFGLARRLESDSKLTATGAILGTPCYMSPEQAQGETGTIGPASDIYSLGATLYELLCGRPPFNAATPWEILCQVLEEEAVPPRLLNPAISRDLETICLKCLQKWPEGRYCSAQALADELGRFLRGEPIQARPVSRMEHLWRWCRRNPRLAVATASSLCLLVTTLIAVSIGYLATSLALEEAEVASARARAAVDRFFTRVSENTLLNEPGLQPLRKELLNDARDYYREFLASRGKDPSLRRDLAQAHFRVGWMAHTADSADVTAQEEFRSALAVLDQCENAENDIAIISIRGDLWTGLGQTSQEMGRPNDAQEAYARAIEYRRRLAHTDHATLEAAGIKPGEARRKTANAYMNLGLLGIAVRDFALARREIRAAQAIREELLGSGQSDPATDFDLAKGYFSLSTLVVGANDFPTAREAIGRAIGLFQKLADGNARSLEYRLRLSQCLHRRGELSAERQAAIADYDRAIAILEELNRQNPEVVEYWEERARLEFSLGAVHLEAKSLAEALARFGAAEKACRAVLARAADHDDVRRLLGEALRCAGIAHLGNGERPGAERSFQEAREQYEWLLAHSHHEEAKSDARRKLDWIGKRMPANGRDGKKGPPE